MKETLPESKKNNGIISTGASLLITGFLLVGLICGAGAFALWAIKTFLDLARSL